MSVSVYRVPRTRPWRGYEKAGNHLEIVLVGDPLGGSVYASCKSAGLGAVIPVSDELAGEALGARRTPCPHVGEDPAYGLFASGDYRCSPLFIASESLDFEVSVFPTCTLEVCDLCGYFTLHSNSLEGETEKEKAGPHPDTTFLAADRMREIVTGASWRDGRLVGPTENDADLTILLKWRWHAEKDGALQAARLMFPDATILADTDRYLVLQDR